MSEVNSCTCSAIDPNCEKRPEILARVISEQKPAQMVEMNFKDYILTTSKTKISIVDRLRILLTGKIEYKVRTFCQNYAGQTSSQTIVTIGKFE